MKLWIKILLALLLIIGLSIAWFYPQIKMLNTTLHLFDEDKIVENFRSFNKKMPHKVLKASSTPYKYAKGDNLVLPENFTYESKEYNTEQFLKDSYTTGFLVIQDDSIVYEKYYLGNTDTTRNISWSMAKSFISTLIGIAVDEGKIKDINQNVEEYVPYLKGSAYEGVTIKQVLQMSTGVRFNEDYGDLTSDINRWGRGFALGESQDEFATTLTRELEPGTVNHYVSINTHVLGMILTKAVGKSITEFMQEKLYTPMGMETDGYWLKDGKDMEMALGGLNLTLRDYAKIGTLFLKKGNWNGNQIVSEKWVHDSITPDGSHVQPTKTEFGYGYQWWLPYTTEGEFMARGVYNQNIFVNPVTNTVIVKLSANPKYNDPDYIPSSNFPHMAMYREIINSLRK